MLTFDHMRNGSFDLYWSLEKDGQPQPIDGWQIDAYLEDRYGTRVVDLNVYILDASQGKFQLSYPSTERTGYAQTDWPLDDLRGVLVMTRGDGVVLPSEPFRIRVYKGAE